MITHLGEQYSLDHLAQHVGHFNWIGQQSQNMRFSVRVRYGAHCYSEEIADPPPAGSYVFKDRDRKRVFCLRRYAHSKGLPAIINAMFEKPTKSVVFTHEKNFSISLTQMEPRLNPNEKYHVFFRVKLSKPDLVQADPHEIDLYVESAYAKNARVAVKSNFTFGKVAERVALRLGF